MDITSQRWLSGRWFIGGALIAVGLIILLMNIGMIDRFPIWKFWPVALIVAGVSRFFQPYHRAEGFWIMAIGIICQWSFLRIGGLGWGDTWPAFLIALGVFQMWESLEKESQRRKMQEQQNPTL